MATILSYRRPRVNRTTKPAVVRPVPVTFGAGILDDGPTLEDARRAEHNARVNAVIDAAIRGREAHNARVNAVIDKAKRQPQIPTPADRAWELGYSLGRDGIEASTYHKTHAESMAFMAGHERGMDEYRDDQRAEVEALIAAWEADHGIDAHEAELAECGSVVGHEG